MNLIKVENLSKDYVNGDVVTHVLYNLAFAIEGGEFVAIMGPSGSGKSTLMQILGFLDRPTSGYYEFEGLDTSKFDDHHLAELRNHKVGFIFQTFNLLSRTTVLNNVVMPLMYAEVPKEKRLELATRALETVGLAQRLNYFTNQISGGEQQRVAIARALINNPAVLFADEPTGNLDSKSGNAIIEILQKLNDQGRTIIMVTHESDTASHAKRIMRMRDGAIVGDEPVINRAIASKERILVK